MLKQDEISRNDVISQNEVLEMARRAGLADEVLVPWSFELHYFAKLVADVATAKEREACAKICEQRSDPLGYANLTAEVCAKAIRARGEPTSRGGEAK